MTEDYPAPPPELSPAAQAVLDAFRTSHTGQGCLAAALRAAADQMSSRHSKAHLYSLADGLKLKAIAAELDGTSTPSENVLDR